MNSLTRWNPWKELDDLQNRFSTLFGTGLPVTARSAAGEAMTVPEWSPYVDVVEDETGYQIKVDLPEVPKDDVNVRVDNGVLYISGERKQEKEEKNKKYHRIERSYGKFVRSFTLPSDVDPAKIEAKFKDGVLQVHLNKTKEAQPKAIDIQVS